MVLHQMVKFLPPVSWDHILLAAELFHCVCADKWIERSRVCDGVVDCECEQKGELGDDENYYLCPPNLEGK